MYAAKQWTPLPTVHGPLGLASQKKGQVTRRDSDDTQHKKGSNKQSTTYFDKIEVSKRRGLAMQHEERIAVTQTKKSLGKDVPEKPFKGYEETCFGPYSDLITDFGSYGWR